MDDEINLLDYGRVLLKWKKTILLIVCVVTCSSALVSLFLPKFYRAEATIMPIGRQQSEGALAMAAAQMGLLGGLLAGFGSTPSFSGQLYAILKSRTMAERMINRYGLMKVFNEKLWDEQRQGWKVEDPRKMPKMEDAVRSLSSIVSFVEEKSTRLLIIGVQMKDPHLAATIVNGYVKELADYIKENTFTTAKRNRIFIEDQLERNKAELLESGKELTAFYTANKISNVTPMVDVDVSVEIRDEERLEAGSKEAQEGDRANTGNPSPKVSDSLPLPGVSAAWADVQKRADELQGKADEMKSKIKEARVVRDVPQQVYLQYLALRRDLLGQVNALLTQKYEIAKIEETKEDLNFQVMDWARVPIRRFKPNRRQIVMTAFAMSFFFAVFYVFFREYLKKMGVGKEV